jgi:hypothetical protein
VPLPLGPCSSPVTQPKHYPTEDGPADRIQVRHAVAVSVLRPRALPFLPDHATYGVGIIRRADPVQHDVCDGGLAERVLTVSFVVNMLTKTSELVLGCP